MLKKKILNNPKKLKLKNLLTSRKKLKKKLNTQMAIKIKRVNRV